MSYLAFLSSTPDEINWKVEAYNEEKREQAALNYKTVVLFLNGRNAPNKFPSFERFYPDKQNKIASKKDERIVKSRLRKHGFNVH